MAATNNTLLGLEHFLLLGLGKVQPPNLGPTPTTEVSGLTYVLTPFPKQSQVGMHCRDSADSTEVSGLTSVSPPSNP